MFSPGGAPWLFRHELRMFLYNAGGANKKAGAARGFSKTTLGVWITLAIALHLVALKAVSTLQGHGDAPPLALVMGATGMLAAAATMMLSTSLRASVEVLFERGDLDLLLSSPLSSRSIFMVRLAAIVAGTAAIYLLFLTPFAHAGLVLGQFQLMAIYPVVISLAMLAAACAMLLTLGLVRTLGVRRTRVVAQVLGALAGAILFLLSQLYSNSMESVRARVFGWTAPLLRDGAPLGPGSLAWLPGEAILGAPWPMLVMFAAGLGAFLLTVHFTHAFFVRGIQQAGSSARKASGKAGALRFNFRRSLAHAVIVKEFRLILRDPQLISQVLLQLLYILPLLAIVLVNKRVALPGIAAGVTFLSASLAAALGWVIVAAEDAPDLLRAAPCKQSIIVRAKIAAVALPPLALTLVPLVWLALSRPGPALMIMCCVCGAVGSAAMIVLWLGRPAKRGEFKTRGRGNVTGNVMETLNGGAWALLAYLLVTLANAPARSTALLAGIGASAVLVVAIVLVARAFRLRVE